ncbi:hypothetical protein PspCFBP13528_16985 [Pseudomonas sp. CFBP13528]|nr:hypothetical protein PspCFBP13528_16985 [Pseudomonas sp. CFBP13528]
MYSCGEFLTIAVSRGWGLGVGLKIRSEHGLNVGGGLPPMAASGPTRMLDWNEYISVSAVTAAMGSAFTAGHFWKRAPKVTKKALAPPLGTSLGSVCPQSDIDVGGRRHAPSMARGG